MLHLREVGGVGRHGHGIAALLPDGLSHAVELGLRPLQVYKGDLGALAGEGVGDGLPNAACAADDDCYLICKFHGSSPKTPPLLDSRFRGNDGCGMRSRSSPIVCFGR